MKYILRKLWISKLRKYKTSSIITAIILMSIFLFLVIFYNQFTYPYLASDIISDAKGGHGGYNVFSIGIYTVIAVCIIVLIKNLFVRWDLKVDDKFVVALTPFIIFGSLMRVCEDAGKISYPYNIIAISPIIYLVVAIIILITIKINKIMFDGEQSEILRGVVSSGCLFVVISIITLFPIKILSIDYSGFVLDILCFGSIGVILLLIMSKFNHDNLKFNRNIYTLIIFAWVLDLSATSLGVENGYMEKNVLSILLINQFGILGFMIEKFILAVLFCIIFEYKTRTTEDEPTKFEWLILAGFYVLGLAPGIRDMMRIFSGV